MKNSKLEVFKTALLLVTAVWLVVSTCEKKQVKLDQAQQEEVSNSFDASLFNFKHRELKNNNVLAATLTAAEIQSAWEGGIKTIIRLNGDGKDAGAMAIHTEAALCESMGIRFYYFNIEGQIPESAERIANLMQGGEVLVHCRNGAHRAPAMAAAYLQRLDIPKNEIIALVGWDKLIQNPGKYARYTAILN